MKAVYSEFDQAALDREYSPSSCIDDINLYLNDYARFSQAARDAALQSKSCQLGLRYGQGQQETLDLFAPATNTGAAPIHVFIHGGYWQELSKEESCFAAPMFQRHGSFFAAINYTLAPHQTLSGIVEENRRAIAWLYSNAAELGFDRHRIFLSGSSAGAHLCAMMLATRWNQFDVPSDVIKGVCAMSGVYDLEPIHLTYVNEQIGMDRAEAFRNSPIHQPIQNSCPVILSYGDNETGEFKRQSDEYRVFLKDNGIAVSSREIEHRNHFDIVLDLMNEGTWLTRQVLTQMGLGE